MLGGGGGRRRMCACLSASLAKEHGGCRTDVRASHAGHLREARIGEKAALFCVREARARCLRVT